MFDKLPPYSLGSLFDLVTDRRWDTNQLNNEIVSREQQFDALGITFGDRILLCHGGSLEFFADLLAVWRVGACAICIDPRLPLVQIENISNFSEVKLVLVGSNTNSSLSLSVPILDLSHNTHSATRKSQVRKYDANGEALILFTSGTTGLPKGVVLTFRGLQARFSLNMAHIGLSHIKKTLCTLPTHFGHGLIGNCLTPLFSGGEVIFSPNPDIDTLSNFGSIIDEHKISFLSSVPTFWNIVTRVSAEPKTGSLKRVHIGSAPLSAELWNQVIEWAGTRNVLNMYGLTETANWVAGASATDFPPTDGLVGKLWGGECRVLTKEQEYSQVGQGEVFLRVPSAMSGYLKQSNLTKKIMQDGWFRTGDYGSIDKSGALRLTGRLKFEINHAGQKIQPEDVDLVLGKHPSVREVCTFGIPDNLSGEIVGVALCLEEGENLDVRGFKSWCVDWLVNEKIPERWFELDELPRNDRGKVNRNLVISLCLDKDDVGG
jgi:oxalate---CoA ligase